MPASAACSTRRRGRGFVSCVQSVSRWTAIAVFWWRGASPSADLPSAISAMTARLSRMRRRSNGCCDARRPKRRAGLRPVRVWTAEQLAATSLGACHCVRRRLACRVTSIFVVSRLIFVLLLAIAGQALAQNPALSKTKCCRRSSTRSRRQRRRKSCSGARPSRTLGHRTLDRLLCPRLPCRRDRTTDQRHDLAGDTGCHAIAIGAIPNSSNFLSGWRKRAKKVGLERASGRRHVATARRTDAHRSHQPSDRAGRGCLADTDA